MKFLLVIVYLFCTHSMAATIWPNGTRLETFQSGFIFGNGETIDSSPSGFLFDNAAQFNGPFVLEQSATPLTPLVGFNKLYFKSDDNLYKLDSLGNESAIGSLDVGGQEQTTLASSSVAVPNNQATELAAGETLLETGNKNLLANSGFEHSTYSTSWTPTGTATFSAETAAPLSGKKSFKAVMSAQTANIIQSTTLYASAREGSQFFIRATIKNTAPSCTLYVVKNSVRQTGSNDQLALSTDGTTRTYELAFLANGTSNGVEIDCASTTGTLIVDDVELSTESSAFIDVAQIGPWISYTPTLQGFGTTTPTTNQCRYRIIGSSLDLLCKFIVGTTTADEARIGLPSGFSASSDALFSGSQIIGNAGRATNGGTEYLVILAEQNTAYVAVGISTGTTAPLTKLNANGFISSGNTFSFKASIPVQGLSNKVTTYSQQCVRDVDCENVFSAKVSSTGVVSDENLDWVDSDCTYGGGQWTCNYKAGVFSVSPNCNATRVFGGTSGFLDIEVQTASSIIITTRNSSGVATQLPFNLSCQKQGADYKAKNIITGSFQGIEKCADPYECTDTFSAVINTTTGTVGSENIDWINGNCTNAFPNVCSFNSGVFTTTPSCVAISVGGTQTVSANISTQSNTSVSIRNSTNTSSEATAFNLICQKQGADFRPKTAVAGTFLDSVTSPGAGKVALCSSLYDSSNVEQNDYCGFVVSNSGTSPRTWTFVTDFWAETPNCWCNAGYGSGFLSSCDTHAVSVTGATTRMYNDNAGPLVNNNVTLFCHGKIK